MIRRPHYVASLMICAYLQGCGGKTVEDDGGGAGGSGGAAATQNTSATSTKATATKAASTATKTTVANVASTGSVLSCSDLLTAINDKLALAQVCNPAAPQNECTQAVEGVCCPVSMNPANGMVLSQYSALMFEYRNRPECTVGCPRIPCDIAEPGKCIPGANGGACRP